MLTDSSTELTSSKSYNTCNKGRLTRCQIPGALSSSVCQSLIRVTHILPLSGLHVSFLQMGRVPKAWRGTLLRFSLFSLLSYLLARRKAEHPDWVCAGVLHSLAWHLRTSKPSLGHMVSPLKLFGSS